MAVRLGKKPPPKRKPPKKPQGPYAGSSPGLTPAPKAKPKAPSRAPKKPVGPYSGSKPGLTPAPSRAPSAPPKKSAGPYAGSSPGLTSSPATKTARKRSNRRMRGLEAADYESKAVENVLTRNVEIDPDTGKVVTETKRVPLLKTSERKIKGDLKDLRRSLRVAKMAGADPDEVKSAKIAGERRVAQENFKLDQRGEIRFREVEIPKVKTSRKQIAQELKAVKREAKMIRKGRTSYSIKFRAPTEHRTFLTDAVGAVTPVMGDLVKYGRMTALGPTGALAEEFFRKNAPKAVKALVEYQKRSERTSRAGIGPQPMLPEWAESGRTKLMRGIRTGVLTGFEGLTRPGLAVEQELARALAGANNLGNASPFLELVGKAVLTKKARRKFERAPSGLEAILKGHEAKGLVTGGNLGEELFGLKQLGLPIDLITDPLMYFTFAGAPAKFAMRSAAMTERLARKAPDAIKDVKFATLSAQAAKSGDYEFLHNYLVKLAQENGVSLRRLGKQKGERAAVKEIESSIRERGRELAGAIAKGTQEAPRTRLSSKALRGAAEEAARYGLRRQVRPGFQVEFRPLLLKKAGGVSIYAPEKLAGLRFVPRLALVSDLMGKSRSNELIKEIRAREVTEGVNRELAAEHTRLLDEVRVAQRSPDQRVLSDAERALRTFEDRSRELKAELTEQARAASLARQSPREITTRLNSKRFAHEMWRFPRSLGTGVQITTQRAFRTAMKPVMKDKVARGRIGLHLMYDADTQMRGLLESAVPLSAKEQQVLQAVREVNEEMAAFGIDLGTIESVRDNYFFRDWQRGGDVLGPIDAGDFATKLKPTGGKRGSRSAPQMHRHMAEALAMADPTRIASMVMKVGGRKITREKAAEIAERGYQFSLTRFAAEDMAQYLQRGGILREESMTPVQKMAYAEANRWESAGEQIPPLFQELDATDGILKLSDRGIQYHGLKENPFDGLSGREALRVAMASARESEAKLEDAVRLADNGSKAKQHYEAALTQRRAELRDLEDRLYTGGSPSEDLLRTTRLPEATATKKPADERAIVEQDIKGLKEHRKEVEQELSDLQGGIKAAPDVKAKKSIAESYSARAADIEAIDEELNTLQRQLNEMDSPSLAEEAANYEIRDIPPPRTTDGAEGPTAAQVGLAGDDELGDFVPNATEDYIGTLRDFRRDHPDEFPIIDPMLSNYHRTRSEGLQTVFQLRWKGIDAAVGRSMTDAQRNRYVLADGREGFVTDLKLDYGPLDNPHDKPVAYILRDTDDRIEPEDISFPEPTLIPNKNHDIWYDPQTGHEYRQARMFDEGVGDAIERSIGKGRLWPTHVMDNVNAEFLRMGEGGIQDLYDSGIEAGWRKLRSLQRYGVTTLFPAFAVRNMISDALLSTTTDPGVWFHPIANTKMAAVIAMKGGKVKIGPVEFGLKHVRIPSWGKVKSEDMLAAMETLGLHTGQHISEFAQLAEKGDIKTIEHWFQRKVWKRPAQIARGGFGLGPSGVVGRFAREANTRLQDIPRMVTFAQAMRATKGDFAESMWRTIKTHFDYGDLTAAERRTARNLFLFYTWYRKNIPFQFLNLIMRPGFFSAITHTYIDTAQGEAPWNFDWSKVNPMLPNMAGKVPHAGLVPDYMFTSLSALSTSWNGHALAVGFGAPWADMNLVTNMLTRPNEGMRQAAGLLAPELTGLFEYALKKNLLTGRDLGGKESSGYAEILNFMTERLGIALPTGEDGRPVLPWQANLALNQIPILNRGSNYFRGSISSAEDQGRMNKLMGGGLGSFFTGLNAYVSPKEGSRLHYAYINRVIGRAQQRRAFSEEANVGAKELAEFDKETFEWAKQLGIPRKYLEVVPSIGKAYITQEEREGFHLSGESPLTGGSGGLSGVLGGSGGGLGGLDLDGAKKEYNSEGAEALEKLERPGKFQDQRVLPGILGQGVTGEDEIPALATGVGSAGPKQLAAAEWRLRANALARKGVPVPRTKPGTVKGYDADQVTNRPKGRKSKYDPQLAKEAAKLNKAIFEETLRGGKPKGLKAQRAIQALKKKFPDTKPFIKDVIQASQHYGVPAPLLIAIYDIESNFGELNDVTSSAGAQGHMQFMPETWEGYGVDANKSGTASPYERKDAMFAAAKYLRASYDQYGNWDDAIYAYNHADWYVEDVKSRASAYDSPLWGKVSAKSASNTKTKKWGGSKRGKISGTLEGVTDDAKSIGRAIAGISGQKVDVISGYRPGAVTTSGNVSDHASGNALDIHALDQSEGGSVKDEQRGNKIAWAAGVAAGVDPKDPDLLAFVKNGGVFEATTDSGYRVQLLWKTDEGGNHHNHVHVGIEGGSESTGSLSYSGSGMGFSTSSAGGSGAFGVGGFTAGSNAANYNIGASKATEQSVAQMNQRLLTAAPSGGSSGGTSLGTGAFLTPTETFNLGGATDPFSIVLKLRKELEKTGKL